MKNITFPVLLILFSFAVFTACSEDDNAIPEVSVKRTVEVLFSPRGLGDKGYNDLILRGLQRFHRQNPEVDFTFYSPNSLEEGERIFRKWIASETASQDSSLFVLASSDYEEIAANCLKEASTNRISHNVLLFESENPHGLDLRTFQISMYGASFLAGATVAQHIRQPLLVLANDTDLPARDAINGFEHGYQAATKQALSLPREYLAADWHGYDMSEEVYLRMFEWEKIYDFVYAVAGGSNRGIYRFLREHNSLYGAGMDTDQSLLSNRIIGSLLKHIDRLIVDYLTTWKKGKEQEKNLMFGLESGYVDWQVAPDYLEVYSSITDKWRTQAIIKEKEYMQKNRK